MKRVAIIGAGQFGQFMAEKLSPFCQVTMVTRNTDPSAVTGHEVVIFAVPVQHLQASAERLASFIDINTLVVDVCSVKVVPQKILSDIFPKHERLGTHPIFGPQSGKDGITGLPIVLCNSTFSPENFTLIRNFLKQELQLKVFEETAEQHDEQMARVQGLTHFIGRALSEIDIKSYVTNTRSYEQLLELRRLLSSDSWDLFVTIENWNPAAKIVRTELLSVLNNLDVRLQAETTDID